MNRFAPIESVRTVAQARALPEVKDAFSIEHRRVLVQPEPGVGKKGDTVIWREPRPFCPTPVDGDQILFFIDADGRAMQVIYTPEGPAKSEFRL